MARRLNDEYKRKTRTRKKTMLIGAEGKNKTEKNYLANYNIRNGLYRVMMANGNSTDPVRMVEDIIKTMKLWDISAKYGDKIYCLLDSDESKDKNTQIKDAIKLAEQYNIEVIISNPCFEDWYLCHYVYTTKYLTNVGVIDELKKYIPNYQKNMNIYPQISHLTDNAIVNAKKQCNYHKELNNDINKVEANPSTEIYKIVEEFMKNNFE